MLNIRNDDVAIFCNENRKGLAILDIKRGTRWVLDEKSLIYAGNEKIRFSQMEFKHLVPEAAEVDEGGRLVVSFKAGSHTVKWYTASATDMWKYGFLYLLKTQWD